MAGKQDRGPRSLDRASGQPLWIQLLADLRRRLDADEFTAAFPGELTLGAEYEISRHTVREALRVLREEGRVTAARGRAPRLAEPAEIQQPLGALYSLFASVEAAGLAQRSIVRTLDVRADGVIAARLGLEESTPLVYLERLRLAGADPLAVDRVWLPASLAAPLLDADFSHTGLYQEYRERCEITVTGGQESIRAVMPSDAERQLLGIGSDIATFSIERLGCSYGQPAEWRHTLVRGDRFGVTAQFSARSGYQFEMSAPHRYEGHQR
ncbi:UTRA domain-containing protein [Pseudonocardia petroleophila]|uniref:GntR family transcriptional regulator n=1 Tax=Pseudonocardia petroleophila TaxID=37331 RepID=A0A7G7MQS7_9PSEU|nr:GntR family transcriptional regulator [Pseudonocardia petroleophila]QNG55138.1 GntR family transcriptional regulator [Pseudonocardia petroleophila]